MTLIKPSDDTVKVKGPGAIPEALGEWCLRRGLATPEEIESCLKAQRTAEQEGKTPPRLGEMLVARGILTPHQVSEALAAQKKEIRSCARCGIQINVSTRGDAASYRCGRCGGPLTSPETGAPLNAVDEEFILVSKDPLPPEVASARLNPANRFGKYILVKRVGQGGIGVVYLAWDTFLSQYVALKRLRTARPQSPQDTPNEHVQSLLKEARNAIRLRHPGIVSVYDVGRVGREYYVAMEYLEGDTLGAQIWAARQRGTPSPYYENPGRTLDQLIEIARALQYAHSRPAPIVHCDLKPANILIDSEHRAHVLDFGLARNLELDKPEEGEISGTPSYMAPEQASGESDKIDRRTDVYAFGAVLYEVLTGRAPFVGGTMEIIGKTIGDAPDRPSETLKATEEASASGRPTPRNGRRIPPALEELCLRCLNKDRAHRPQSMEEVAEILQANVPVETPQPAPIPSASLSSPGQPERSRLLRRAAALAAGLAILMAGGSALVQFLRSAPSGRPSFEARERDILSATSRFHPGHARDLATRLRDEARGTVYEARASRLLEETTWELRLQGRVADRLAAHPVDRATLATAGGRLTSVRFVSADAAGLRLIHSDLTQNLPWESLEPAVLIEVLRLLIGEPDDADLLGLAILALRNGLVADAGLLFARLRSTSLGPVAERYQTAMND